MIIKESEGSALIEDSPGYLEVIACVQHLCHYAHYKVYELSNEIDLNKEGLVISVDAGTAQCKIDMGPRLYTCLICGVFYNQKSRLQIHLRKHLGVKPYVCQYCGSKFTEKGNLNVHVKSHLG